MGKVTGLGGVFFKAENPDGLMDWYRRHLGIASDEYGCMFQWREADAPENTGYTVWCPFASNTNYFGPSDKPYMVNYRVEDLSGLIEDLRTAGVQVVGDVEEHPNGKFAWILDPEGNKLELWEPIDCGSDPYLASPDEPG